jgi:hypothetical protein
MESLMKVQEETSRQQEEADARQEALAREKRGIQEQKRQEGVAQSMQKRGFEHATAQVKLQDQLLRDREEAAKRSREATERAHLAAKAAHTKAQNIKDQLGRITDGAYAGVINKSIHPKMLPLITKVVQHARIFADNLENTQYTNWLMSTVRAGGDPSIGEGIDVPELSLTPEEAYEWQSMDGYPPGGIFAYEANPALTAQVNWNRHGAFLNLVEHASTIQSVYSQLAKVELDQAYQEDLVRRADLQRAYTEFERSARARHRRVAVDVVEEGFFRGMSKLPMGMGSPEATIEQYSEDIAREMVVAYFSPANREGMRAALAARIDGIDPSVDSTAQLHLTMELSSAAHTTLDFLVPAINNLGDEQGGGMSQAEMERWGERLKTELPNFWREARREYRQKYGRGIPDEGIAVAIFQEVIFPRVTSKLSLTAETLQSMDAVTALNNARGDTQMEADVVALQLFLNAGRERMAADPSLDPYQVAEDVAKQIPAYGTDREAVEKIKTVMLSQSDMFSTIDALNVYLGLFKPSQSEMANYRSLLGPEESAWIESLPPSERRRVIRMDFNARRRAAEETLRQEQKRLTQEPEPGPVPGWNTGFQGPQPAD